MGYVPSDYYKIRVMEFTLKTKIHATAEEIFRAWLSSRGHTAISGALAVASDKVGEEFAAWDGYIKGRNLELEPYQRILQSWRTSEFEEHEEDSIIEILLTEKDGQTELTLIHTNLPEHGKQYINGWEDHYFKPMKDYFLK